MRIGYEWRPEAELSSQRFSQAFLPAQGRIMRSLLEVPSDTTHARLVSIFTKSKTTCSEAKRAPGSFARVIFLLALMAAVWAWPARLMAQRQVSTITLPASGPTDAA